MKIKMLKQKKASGVVLAVDRIVGDEISDQDKGLLVRMGAAEIVKEAPEKKEAPADLGIFDGRSKVDEIKEALDKLKIDHADAKNKKDLLALLPEDMRK